jgi:hypothetical protein
VALVGAPLPNAAVTALRVDRDASGDRVFVAWEGFGVETPGIGLVVDGEATTVRPGGPGRRSAALDLPSGARLVEARLRGPGDALAADDAARARLVPGRREIGLVGPDPAEALVAALRAVVGDGLILGGPGRDGGVGLGAPGDADGRWIVIRPERPWRGFRVTPEEGPIPVAGTGLEDDALRPAFPPGLPEALSFPPAGRLVVPDGARVLLRAPDGRPLAAATDDALVLAFDPADPRGNYHRSGAHAVLWRGLVEIAFGRPDRWVAEGLLDARESDLRGEVRAPDLGVELPARETVTTRSLSGIPALLAALALVLLLGRRGATT